MSNVSLYYAIASEVCSSLNICLILPRTSRTVVNKSRIFDIIITNDTRATEGELVELASIYGVRSKEYQIFRYPVALAEKSTPGRSDIITHSSVCVGGTFDMLHYGHKVLLSIAAVLADRHLLVGITDVCLLRKKFLAPLIQTFEAREAILTKFLTDIDFPEDQLEICRLADPYGPPSNRPDFQCIVASPETITGCEKINETRRDLGFAPLYIEKVEYIPACQNIERLFLPHDYVDCKFSSSTLRLNLLGRPLRNGHAVEMKSKNGVWLIGLTGCVGSGKSSIANHLKELAGNRLCIVDVDLICRQVYESDPGNFTNLGNYFALAPIQQLDALLEIGDLERQNILSSVELKISRLQLESHANPLIVVLEGAVIFKVGLDALCDEIWTVYLPRSEAVTRIAKLCDITDEGMLSTVIERVSESNVDWWTPCQRGLDFGPIGLANIVFCTSWDLEFTRKQVERALKYLFQSISVSF